MLIRLDRSSPVPLYFQVAQHLEHMIESGELPMGTRLENETDLAGKLGLSRPTMRRAIEYLVDRGLLVRKRGIGTQVVHAKITREVNHPNIKVNYGAGNVMDYLEGKVNPLTDLAACAEQVRSFCIKDHRFFPPPHQDCGPGLGEVDHYRLLRQVAFTGLTIPLCCENIFAPRIPRPTQQPARGPGHAAAGSRTPTRRSLPSRPPELRRDRCPAPGSSPDDHQGT